MDAAVFAARAAFDSVLGAVMRRSDRLAVLEECLPFAFTGSGTRACLDAADGRACHFCRADDRRLDDEVRSDRRLAKQFPFVEYPAFMVVKSAVVAQEPVGVVAAISPWNAPYGIMLNKVAYALAAGCTVIMKPSPETPLEAYIIAEAAKPREFPPDLNLACAHREASEHLVRNPGVTR